MPYLKGPKVDPSDEMPDGRAFANIDEFKKLLLADKDQVARALTEKLVTYATGGPPEAADRAEDRRDRGKDPQQELRLPNADPRDRRERFVPDEMTR